MLELIKPSTKQRLWGFGIGAAAASFVYFSTMLLVARQTAEVAQEHYGAPKPASPKQLREAEEQPLVGPKVWATLTRKWNQGVDATVGALAAELARRGL
ncbi:hypothetical protein HYH03_006382 [Edaphochlamys debaryana]|uniref:Uncharacterized protein n=1 Tax=Edaphochlamys debaryana TaxID=47281 RepID=A0A835Y3N3_9CHLO|nr:hypothetical protein HYH03_006382 [Edaphochlamys debaryana]|eukprot:KAG2495435.1 hypothetical protein HYH03_006382 [Edaphochlamys debaryana]